MDETKYWLGFSAFPGIGPLRFKLLRDYFGSVKNAWTASESDLNTTGLGITLTRKFVDFRATFSLDNYIAEIQKKNIGVITLEESDYPKLLKEITDAPFLLYFRGERSRFQKIIHPIGVVGTRMITHYGREVTIKITEGLVTAGCTIVSGLAYGVDAVAHQTAIEMKGNTVAVLGCGVDVIHPRINTTLYWQIVKEHGLVISEYPVGQFAAKGLFPARNRIISGLSLGTVVTEGAEDSGALITASYAGEQGREVFAVPGPITSSLSKGPIKLLKQGAKLVTEVSDILDELRIRNKPVLSVKMNNLTKQESKILEFLEKENLHLDEIARKCEIPAANVGSILTMMEMKKIVKHIGGGIYGI